MSATLFVAIGAGIAASIDAAISMIAGTARSMGITVED